LNSYEKKSAAKDNSGFVSPSAYASLRPKSKYVKQLYFWFEIRFSSWNIWVRSWG